MQDTLVYLQTLKLHTILFFYPWLYYYS